MKAEEPSWQLGHVIAKCWADEGFKKKLLSDPMETLKDEGVELPSDLTVKAVENTDNVFYLVIPTKPADLSDEELETIIQIDGPRECEQCEERCSNDT